MIPDGRDAAASIRDMIVADILRLTPPSNVGRAREVAVDRSPQDASGPMKVVTTVRCVNTETCGHRFDLGYLPAALPGCAWCGGRTVLVKVLKG